MSKISGNPGADFETAQLGKRSEQERSNSTERKKARCGLRDVLCMYARESRQIKCAGSFLLTCADDFKVDYLSPESSKWHSDTRNGFSMQAVLCYLLISQLLDVRFANFFFPLKAVILSFISCLFSKGRFFVTIITRIEAF